jgi:cytochrome P450
MQSPSFLAHQRVLAAHCGRSHAETLFGITAISCDNHIRQMLDGVPPDHFDPVFAKIVKELDASGGLKPLRRLGGRMLIALDGSEHFRARKVHRPHCSTRRRTVGVGAARRRHRYRWIEGVPLRDGKDALVVNWLEIEIAEPNGKLTRNGRTALWCAPRARSARPFTP